MAEEQQDYYSDNQGENGQNFGQVSYGGDQSGGYAGAGDQDSSNTGRGFVDDDDERKIFVGGLSWETTEQELKTYFSNYGEITNCTLKTEPNTGKSRGFGFVVFAETSAVDKVLEIGTHKLHGRNIDPKKANPKRREPNLKVFVGGLSTDTLEPEIREHFEKFGAIAEIDLPVDPEKKRRGFCFIKFESEDVVRKVVENRMQLIGGKEVEVKKSVPKHRENQAGGWGSFGGRGGGRGGRGGYGGGGWNQGGYNQGGYGGYGNYNQGYGNYNQGYGNYNQGGYGNYGGYDYNQGYGNGGWGSGYDQGYGGYDYSGWGGYGQDQSQSAGYGKTQKRGGAHGYQPY